MAMLTWAALLLLVGMARAGAAEAVGAAEAPTSSPGKPAPVVTIGQGPVGLTPAEISKLEPGIRESAARSVSVSMPGVGAAAAPRMIVHWSGVAPMDAAGRWEHPGMVTRIPTVGTRDRRKPDGTIPAQVAQPPAAASPAKAVSR